LGDELTQTSRTYRSTSMTGQQLPRIEEASARIVDISGANYDDIPRDYFSHASCQSCLYWETEAAKSGSAREREVLKRVWFNRVGSIFGPCGKLVYVNSRVVAWAQYAPANSFPRAATYRNYPSEDAYLISCLAVSPEVRRRGYGEMLLRAIIDDLRGRGVKAVETFAKKDGSDNPSGPVEFFLERGFRVLLDDEQFPLLRFELEKVPLRDTSVVSLGRL